MIPRCQVAELAAGLGLTVADVVYAGRGGETVPDWLLEVRAGAGGAQRVGEPQGTVESDVWAVSWRHKSG